MKYAQMLKCLCIEFGMTPSSRGRLELPNEEKGDDFASKLRSKIA
jgi:phage terminase small subunit